MKTRPVTPEELKAWTKAEIRRLLKSQANAAKSFRAAPRDAHEVRQQYRVEIIRLRAQISMAQRMCTYALNGELEE